MRVNLSQLEANAALQIIEKPLFFISFSNILWESLKAFGNALENTLGRLGDALGTFWKRMEKLWGHLGMPLMLWKALGAPWEALGAPWEAFSGEPAGNQVE